MTKPKASPAAPQPIAAPLPPPTHPLVLRTTLQPATEAEEAAWRARTGGADVDTLLRRIEDTEGLLGEQEALGILDHPDERVLAALVQTPAWGGAGRSWGGRTGTVMLPWLWNRVVDRMRRDGVDWSELAQLVGSRLYESSDYERTWRRSSSSDPDAVPEAFTTDGRPFPQVWFAERNAAFAEAQDPEVWTQLLKWQPPTVLSRMARSAPTLEPHHVRTLVESQLGETLLRNPAVQADQDRLYVVFRWAMEQMDTDSGLSKGALLAQQVLARGLKSHGRLQRALDTRRKRRVQSYYTHGLDSQPAWILWLQSSVGVAPDVQRATMQKELPPTCIRALTLAASREDLWTPQEAMTDLINLGYRWGVETQQSNHNNYGYVRAHPAQAEALERAKNAPKTPDRVPPQGWQGLALRADAWADPVVGPLLEARRDALVGASATRRQSMTGQTTDDPLAYSLPLLQALDTPQLLDKLVALAPDFRGPLLTRLLGVAPAPMVQQLVEHLMEGPAKWRVLIDKALIRHLLLDKQPEVRRLGTALMTLPRDVAPTMEAPATSTPTPEPMPAADGPAAGAPQATAPTAVTPPLEVDAPQAPVPPGAEDSSPAAKKKPAPLATQLGFDLGAPAAAAPPPPPRKR